jgi:hypothetical protein
VRRYDLSYLPSRLVTFYERYYDRRSRVDAAERNEIHRGYGTAAGIADVDSGRVQPGLAELVRALPDTGVGARR